MNCVVCGKYANYVLIQKDSKKEYPICEECVEKEWYNKDVFDVNKRT